MDLVLPDIEIIELPRFQDGRGSFAKLFDTALFSDFRIAQTNHVTSGLHVLRGLHFQRMLHAESKIFTVLKGKIQLTWFSLHEKKAGTMSQLLPGSSVRIPKGYATGYLVLEEKSEVLYFSNSPYAPEHEGGIRWNDPALAAIAWQVPNPICSEKDLKWPDFK